MSCGDRRTDLADRGSIPDIWDPYPGGNLYTAFYAGPPNGLEWRLSVMFEGLEYNGPNVSSTPIVEGRYIVHCPQTDVPKDMLPWENFPLAIDAPWFLGYFRAPLLVFFWAGFWRGDEGNQFQTITRGCRSTMG